MGKTAKTEKHGSADHQIAEEGFARLIAEFYRQVPMDDSWARCIRVMICQAPKNAFATSSSFVSVDRHDISQSWTPSPPHAPRFIPGRTRSARPMD